MPDYMVITIIMKFQNKKYQECRVFYIFFLSYFSMYSFYKHSRIRGQTNSALNLKKRKRKKFSGQYIERILVNNMMSGVRNILDFFIIIT